MPALIYGTAWKKDQTRALVKTALLAGFRAVDTAAQPKHYQEYLVGAGIRDALRECATLKRADLYIQTKYTSIHGQDPGDMPYDPSSSITEQVNASVASSLHNIWHTDLPQDAATTTSSAAYIDCLVLHSPFPSPRQTEEAWRAMEAHVPHSVRTLGISNIYHLPALHALYDFAKVKPSVVQNRFYAETGYDTGIRAFCAQKGITYQSFWTLTASPRLLASDVVGLLAQAAGVSRPVALYGSVLGLGNVSVLDGTKNARRMKEDLEGMELIRAWAGQNPGEWERMQGTFGAALQDG